MEGDQPSQTSSSNIKNSLVASPVVQSKGKTHHSETRTQFSSRSGNADRVAGKPPLKPRLATELSPIHASQIPTSSIAKVTSSAENLQLPAQTKGPELTSRSSSPKLSSSPSPVAGPIPLHASTIDHLPSHRVAPLLTEAVVQNNSWSLDSNIHECISLRDSEMFFVSEQIVVCVKNKATLSDHDALKVAVSSTSSMWGGPTGAKKDGSSGKALVAAAEEAAMYMNAEYASKHSVVVNSLQMSKIPWGGPIHFIQESAYQPAPLQESVMLLLFLERFLVTSKDNVVLFFEGNSSVICALLRLMDPSAMYGDSATLLADLCALKKEQLPMAGARRYLAMLEMCMTTPELVDIAPTMVLASMRLYGDPDFVRSTESLIRVHAEIHHSTVVDSTDFREQISYRITRGSEAEACLVVSFLPCKLAGDVRIVIFSTLKSDSGLTCGPKAMLQISFHTAFVETSQSINFLHEDIDALQGFCPIKRIVLSPGERLGYELMAPEVKFVRKKLKSNNPLDIIADLLIPLTPRKADDWNDDEDRTLHDCRPVEVRIPGKVFRDDSQGSSRPASRNSSSPGSGRTTPVQGANGDATPGRSTPTRSFVAAAAFAAANSPSGAASGGTSRSSPRINPSPRFPVSPLQAMDGQVEGVARPGAALASTLAARRFKPISSPQLEPLGRPTARSPPIAAPSRAPSGFSRPPPAAASPRPIDMSISSEQAGREAVLASWPQDSPAGNVVADTGSAGDEGAPSGPGGRFYAHSKSAHSDESFAVSGKAVGAGIKAATGGVIQSGQSKPSSGRTSTAESRETSRPSTPRSRLELQGSRPDTPQSRTGSTGSNACAELGFALTPRGGGGPAAASGAGGGSITISSVCRPADFHRGDSTPDAAATTVAEVSIKVDDAAPLRAGGGNSMDFTPLDTSSTPRSLLPHAADRRTDAHAVPNCDLEKSALWPEHAHGPGLSTQSEGKESGKSAGMSVPELDLEQGAVETSTKPAPKQCLQALSLRWKTVAVAMVMVTVVVVVIALGGSGCFSRGCVA